MKARLKIVSKKLAVVHVSYTLMNIETEMGLPWVFISCHTECNISILTCLYQMTLHVEVHYWQSILGIKRRKKLSYLLSKTKEDRQEPSPWKPVDCHGNTF